MFICQGKQLGCYISLMNIFVITLALDTKKRNKPTFIIDYVIYNWG